MHTFDMHSIFERVNTDISSFELPDSSLRPGFVRMSVQITASVLDLQTTQQTTHGTELLSAQVLMDLTLHSTVHIAEPLG